MQRSRADGTYCVLLKTIAVCTIESTSQFFVPLLILLANYPARPGTSDFYVIDLDGSMRALCIRRQYPLLHNPVGVGQCRFFFSRRRWMGGKKWRVLPAARMPLLVPGVPYTISGCVYPCGNRGVHRDAPNRVMQASHPPMPCDPPCLVARPCLYSAQEDRQPRPTCRAHRRASAGRLVPTACFSPGDRPWPRHPRLDAMPRFPMSR
jgi:hypothetical protein